jgi:hypothetical protein
VATVLASPSVVTLGALNLKAGNRMSGAVLLATGVASLVAVIVAAVEEARIIRHTPLQMKQKNVNRLYNLLQRFQKVAETTGLEYFAICGTLIGAARHGGLMQWDDDVDLGMMQEQARRLLTDTDVLKANQSTKRHIGDNDAFCNGHRQFWCYDAAMGRHCANVFPCSIRTSSCYFARGTEGMACQTKQSSRRQTKSEKETRPY